MSGFLQKARAFQERFFQMCCRRYLPRRLANSLQSLHEERILCLVDARHRRFSFLLFTRALEPLACFPISHFPTPNSQPPLGCTLGAP